MNQNPTLSEIKEMFAETSKRIEENALKLTKQRAEADELFFKRRVEFEEQIAKRREEQANKRREEEAKRRAEIEKQEKKRRKAEAKRRAEIEEQENKRRAEIEEQEKRRREEYETRIKNLEELVGGIGNSNGEMAEDYFYNAFLRDRTFANQKFDDIRRNMIYSGKGDDLKLEYDIMLFNGTNAAIIEVKYSARPKNVSIEKLISRIEILKICFPEYKNHKIYLGVAALSFNGKLVKELHNAGIATVRQVGKKMVIYDKNLKVF